MEGNMTRSNKSPANEICATDGELLDALEKADISKANPALRKMMLEGRGRNSARMSKRKRMSRN
jgi:hypothetical protein